MSITVPTRIDSKRFPPWLAKKIPVAPDSAVASAIASLNLDTVCRGARCPNAVECRAAGRAAFLILGPNCTRRCRFCAMAHAEPAPPNPTEPARLAEAAKRLALTHVVVTSVTRDDLPDGGAGHFAATVRSVRQTSPNATIEILVPDFWGDTDAWEVAADSLPDVFNHNIETVERLYPAVRPEADFDRSLALLDFAKERHPNMATKSGLMVGLGEELDEIIDAAAALRDVGVDIVTVGQYLQPKSAGTLPVARFVTPEEFADLERELSGLGFRSVACAPFVRSSYNAEEAFLKLGKTP